MRMEDKDRKRPHRRVGLNSDRSSKLEEWEAGMKRSSRQIIVPVQTYLIQISGKTTKLQLFCLDQQRYYKTNITDVEIMLMSGTAPALISAEFDVLRVIYSVIALYSSTDSLPLREVSLREKVVFIQFEADDNSQHSEDEETGHCSHVTSILQDPVEKYVPPQIKFFIYFFIFCTGMLLIIKQGWSNQLLVQR